MNSQVTVDRDRIESFCGKWNVRELSLFGSVLTDEFRTDSDVDVLVVFDEDAGWSAFDIVEMIDELRGIFGRKVDLVEKDAIRNPFRRHHILRNHEVIYAA
jgi:predicted nucleotidyltransferase